MSSSIRSHSEQWRLLAVLLALWGLAPLPASGAEPTDAAKAQARVKFDAGNEAYARGDFRQALVAFDEAYQIAPLPGFLFNVAQCYRQLGAFERAAFFYRRYLALSAKEPPNAQVVRELIAEMDTQARQEAASRAGREKPVVQAKAAEKDRPVAIPAKAPEASGDKKMDSALKAAEKRALDIRKSRSLSAVPRPVPGPTEPPRKEALTRKWWVWAGAGAAVLLAGGIVYAVSSSDPRPTTLGTIGGR